MPTRARRPPALRAECNFMKKPPVSGMGGSCGGTFLLFLIISELGSCVGTGKLPLLYLYTIVAVAHTSISGSEHSSLRFRSVLWPLLNILLFSSSCLPLPLPLHAHLAFGFDLRFSFFPFRLSFLTRCCSSCCVSRRKDVNTSFSFCFSFPDYDAACVYSFYVYCRNYRHLCRVFHHCRSLNRKEVVGFMGTGKWWRKWIWIGWQME
ncbi:hypothetical protein BDZ91DRAFT_164713 [Kalaharituber pfeilii]|nr:hypothetical protein BDZ91DRAFT_164713 [Kalaharituber pfeilii]